MKARKDQNKKRAWTLTKLVREEDQLRHAQDKHDDQLAEFDMEVKETKMELGKVLAKVDMLEFEKEGNCMEQDDWVAHVVKSMSAEGRTELLNAFQMAAPSLNRGTISWLRKTTEINFRYLPTNVTAE